MQKKQNRTRTIRGAFAVVSALLVTLLLAACGGNGADNAEGASPAPTPAATATATPSATGDSGEERVFKDAMGHEVKVPANPQRIIASYLEDHLVALNVKPVAQWSVPNGVQDYLQSALKDVPTIPYNLPPEQVASFNPDLIIVDTEASVEKGLYEQYSKIAPTYVLGADTNNDWRKALATIGELLGKKDEAEQLLAQYDNKALEVKEKLQEKIGDKTAAVVWLVQKQFYMVGETRSSGEVLYKDLGLTPPKLVSEIPAESKANWNPVSLEKLAELDADYIFLVNSDTETAETIGSAIWKSLPAVKAGHVYEMERKSSWLYSGFVAGERMMNDVSKALLQ